MRYFLLLKQVTPPLSEQRFLCGCVGSCLFLPTCCCFSHLPGKATSALVPVAAFALSSSCLHWQRGEHQSLEGRSWDASLGQFWPWADESCGALGGFQVRCARLWVMSCRARSGLLLAFSGQDRASCHLSWGSSPTVCLSHGILYQAFCSNWGTLSICPRVQTTDSMTAIWVFENVWGEKSCSLHEKLLSLLRKNCHRLPGGVHLSKEFGICPNPKSLASKSNKVWVCWLWFRFTALMWTCFDSLQPDFSGLFVLW